MPEHEYTVTRSAEPGKFAVKRIGPRKDDVQPYDRVTYWSLKRLRCRSHEDFRDAFQKGAPRADIALVSGAPLAWVDLTKTNNYRRSNNPDASTNTFGDTLRSCLCIDTDGVDVPSPLGRGDQLLNSAAYVRDNLLPPAFMGRTCVATPSQRTGLTSDTDARLHLFFMLSKAHLLSALRRWAVGARAAGYRAVDPRVMLPSQPIYTGRPIFRGGLRDPVPEHLHAVIVEGMFGDYVDLDVHQFDAEAEAEAAKANFTGGGGRGSDWRTYLINEVGGTMSFRAPLEHGLGLAAHTGDGEADIVAFARALVIERTRNDRFRRGWYGEDWLLKALRNFRAGDRKTAAEIVKLRSQLFLEGAY